jgi:hypothetical protein
MEDKPIATITAAQMALMSPQARADAIGAATVKAWGDVPEPFKSEVLDTARILGAQRRQRA